ncbi:MAG: ABC transporter permease [Candidatus Aminicenantales bacterium]
METARKKGLRYLLALAVIITINFLLPRAMPGDPLTYLLSEDFVLSPDALEEIRSELGLDKPWTFQYLDYWKDLFHLDLGTSYHFNQKVTALIGSRLKWTLALLIPSIIIGAVVGTLLGAVSGWRKASFSDRVMTPFFLSIYSSPPYFLGIVLLYVFSFKLGVLPFKGFYDTGSVLDILAHLFLPVTVMSAFAASRNYMIMRGSVLIEREKLYVLYARSKGLFGNALLFRHVFKNGILPVITLVALDFGFLLSGALFVEIVFSMNGMGTLIYEALLSRDYPVLQGCFLIIALMVVAANFLADILYRVFDPRVRQRG